MSRRVRQEGAQRDEDNPYPFASMAHYRYSHAIDARQRAEASTDADVAAAWLVAADAWADYAALWWEHENDRGPKPSSWDDVMAVYDAALLLEKEKTP